ncbi:ABC transporter permease [Luteimonas sp. MC1572]|uniref:ABC transporter permease n=1 Tax=Luteimonas sp. MC1572 TaxID=2799325 RepID=UPI0018F10351|nr:ABC transporter permease [Luteimonas sp. MC1572]MBJ6982359.1 ABC transporter permease [Luteimonas sp. MC1572]QQO03625.1 ABC transporter permease [Luteimonas sp. MC1572]
MVPETAARAMGAQRLRRLLAPFSAIGRHADLTRELVLRDILGRYRGATFGLFWSLLGPLMMLVIYTVAFGQILGSRWNQATNADAPFGVVLFLGIMVHGFFAECLGRAPRLMVDNSNYVKRVVFPLHILPWTVMLAAGFTLLANLVVFALLAKLLAGTFSPYIVLVPVVMLPLALLAVAVGWLASSLGVYLRDLSQAIPAIVTALLFLSSAIVPVEALSEQYQLVFKLNPLTFFIDQVREVALWGRPPDWIGWAWRGVASIVILYASYAWFRATSRGFADVL